MCSDRGTGATEPRARPAAPEPEPPSPTGARRGGSAAGLTQEAVSKHFKKPQSFVSKVETGERRIDPTDLQKFARLHKKPLAFFLGGE